MINRILIRTKVVQMLYSYLLTRSEFRIDSAPENGSKDKRYAYAVYSDLLILIQELSGCRITRNKKQPRVDVDPKLARNRVGKALADNDTVKQMVLRGAVDTSKFNALLQPLLDRITRFGSVPRLQKNQSACSRRRCTFLAHYSVDGDS